MLGKLAHFFNQTSGIDISGATQHNDLVSHTGGNLDFCLAEPGDSYYIWLDQGGTPTLNLTGVPGSCRCVQAATTAHSFLRLGPTPQGVVTLIAVDGLPQLPHVTLLVRSHCCDPGSSPIA